ncbi:hypothetical protein BV20DRAFT_968008 [Pilatotrama ljubarskyi]|nr:hypothetical protein BV20DRAFT_968008 [Pilatotrama ljubarskyi]
MRQGTSVGQSALQRTAADGRRRWCGGGKQPRGCEGRKTSTNTRSLLHSTTFLVVLPVVLPAHSAVHGNLP